MRKIDFNAGVDGKFADGKFADGKFTDGEFVGGKFTDGEFADGKFADGKFADGRFTDGEFADGKFADGRFTDGEFTDGKFADGVSVVRLSWHPLIIFIIFNISEAITPNFDGMGRQLNPMTSTRSPPSSSLKARVSVRSPSMSPSSSLGLLLASFGPMRNAMPVMTSITLRSAGLFVKPVMILPMSDR